MPALPAWLTWTAVKGALTSGLGYVWRFLTTTLRLQVWVLVLALVLGWHWHSGRVKAADGAAYARAKAEDAKAIEHLRKRAESVAANASKLAQQIRTKTDEETRAHAAAAADLSMRGSGKARCGQVGNSSVPAASGGPVKVPAKADAAVAQLSDVGGLDLIALPFDGAVKFGRQNDDLISEVNAWHEWHAKISAMWEKLRKP